MSLKRGKVTRSAAVPTSDSGTVESSVGSTSSLKPSSDSPFGGLLIPCLVSLLFGLRFVVPAESAARGDTLWIAQLWCALLLVVSLLNLRSTAPGRRLDLLDAIVWTIVAGHVLSGLTVVLGVGNDRTAINLMWEWVALGVSFHLLRCMLFDVGRICSVRNALVAITVCLTALGFWQHFVFYPQSSTQYAAGRAELDKLLSDKPNSAMEAQRAMRRVQELTRQFRQDGIPLDGQSRILFESRLQASSEPFGPFALANTFGGLLAAVLILQLLQIFSAQKKILVLAVQFLLLLPTGWCLLLTKSRTAWLGLLAGTIYGVWLNRATSDTQHRLTRWMVGAAGLLSIGMAFFVGGLDREVISESPKSIQYRLQYWAGSLEMLRERPLFGSGPGNFRPYYLRHKLAESSEEIADPHNLFIDAWANGGMLALVGLIAFVGFAAWPQREKMDGLYSRLPVTGRPKVLSSTECDMSPDSAAPDSAAQDMSVPLGFGCAFAVAWSYESFTGDAPDVRNFLLLGVFVLVTFLLSRFGGEPKNSSNAFRAAVVGLLVHLFGAGGFGMPGVFQLALMLIALAFPLTWNRDRNGESFRSGENFGIAVEKLWRWLAVGVSAVLCLGILNTGFIPTVSARLHSKLSDFYAAEGQLGSALKNSEQAMSDDPYDPDLPYRLAALFRARWQQNSDPQDFDAALALYQKAIDLDPVSAHRFRGPAAMFSARYEKHGKQTDIESAVDFLKQAVRQYPTDASVVQELHFAAHRAGQSKLAAATGRDALKLDKINHQHGHSDRYLSAEIRQQIESHVGAGRSDDR